MMQLLRFKGALHACTFCIARQVLRQNLDCACCIKDDGCNTLGQALSLGEFMLKIKSGLLQNRS